MQVVFRGCRLRCSGVQAIFRGCRLRNLCLPYQANYQTCPPTSLPAPPPSVYWHLQLPSNSTSTSCLLAPPPPVGSPSSGNSHQISTCIIIRPNTPQCQPRSPIYCNSTSQVLSRPLCSLHMCRTSTTQAPNCTIIPLSNHPRVLFLHYPSLHVYYHPTNLHANIP